MSPENIKDQVKRIDTLDKKEDSKIDGKEGQLTQTYLRKVDNFIEKTPLRRMAYTDDLIGALCFLASDDSSYITGQNILIDGGFTLNQ